MKTERVDRAALWPWVAAAMFAPAAQSLGSAPWPWTLALGLGSMGVFLCAEALTGRDWHMGKAMAVAEYLFLVVCIGTTIEKVDDCWMGTQNTWVIPVTMVILGSLSAELGQIPAARCGATMFWFVAVTFVVLVIFSLPDVETENLYPGRWCSQGTDLGVFLIPGVTLLLPRQRGRNPWSWALIITAGATAISVLTAGALSCAVAADTHGAFFQMVRGMEILGVAERFESLVAAGMTLSWFCLLGLLLSGAGAVGQKLRSGSGRGAVWLAAAAGLLAGLWTEPLPAWVLALGSVILWYGLPAVKALMGRKKMQNG